LSDSELGELLSSVKPDQLSVVGFQLHRQPLVEMANEKDIFFVRLEILGSFDGNEIVIQYHEMQKEHNIEKNDVCKTDSTMICYLVICYLRC